MVCRFILYFHGVEIMTEKFTLKLLEEAIAVLNNAPYESPIFLTEKECSQRKLPVERKQ